MRTTSPRRRPFLEGTAIVAFALLSTFFVARIGLEPSDLSVPVGVIFPPWTDARSAFTRAVGAGGRFIRFGGPSFVVVVEPEGTDYARRVKESGALLLVDPRVLAACLSWTSTEKDRT